MVRWEAAHSYYDKTDFQYFWALATRTLPCWTALTQAAAIYTMRDQNRSNFPKIERGHLFSEFLKNRDWKGKVCEVSLWATKKKFMGTNVKKETKLGEWDSKLFLTQGFLMTENNIGWRQTKGCIRKCEIGADTGHAMGSQIPDT